MAQRKRKSRDEWERIVGGQSQSGLTAAAFCRRENVGLSSFYQWKRRLSEVKKPEVASSKEPFIDMGRLGASETSTVGANSLEMTLDLGDGARLTLRRG